jgi:predicted transcriptional regulator
MHLHDVLTITQAKLFSPGSAETYLDGEVRSGFGADLMSDVLHYDVAQGLLITGLINPQIVRTAEMADAAAILMVRGKTPLAETIELAQQVDMPIIGTHLTMFETCGRLYTAGLAAARRQDESA